MNQPPAPPAAECAAQAHLHSWDCIEAQCNDGTGCICVVPIPTQPAAPAAQCPMRSTLEAISVWPPSYPANANIERIRQAASAALAAPCQHGSEQSEIARLQSELAAEIDTSNTNDEVILHLRAELAQARKATEESQACGECGARMCCAYDAKHGEKI